MCNRIKTVSAAGRWLLYGRIIATLAGFIPSLIISRRGKKSLVRLFAAESVRNWSFLFPSRVWKVDGKYYWNPYAPGFPSPSFRKLVAMEINRRQQHSNAGSLGTLIMAVTKKCPLNCEHCFEGRELNNRETLDEQRISAILDRRLYRGWVGQVIFSGGEPMTRYPLLQKLVSRYRGRCELWIATSGLGLTADRAYALKRAGLTGVMISLDHHEPAAHDRFRGFPDAWAHAMEAAQNARAAGLLTMLNLVAVRENVREDFLESYLILARDLGVQFVQFIEPRSEGRYAEKPVDLDKEQHEILGHFYFSVNRRSYYRDFPTIVYPDYNRRRFGCLAGEMSAYIDTNGEEHPCPFCKGPGQSCGSRRVCSSRQQPATAGLYAVPPVACID